MPDRITEGLPPGYVDVPTSAAGPSQKLKPQKDGTVRVESGKAHEAREGKVLSPGVKTVGSVGTGPSCPHCSRTGTLKMHMNKKSGERIYCTSCGYDQAKVNAGQSGVKTVTAHAEPQHISGGVKIVRQSGPRG